MKKIAIILMLGLTLLGCGEEGKKVTVVNTIKVESEASIVGVWRNNGAVLVFNENETAIIVTTISGDDEIDYDGEDLYSYELVDGFIKLSSIDDKSNNISYEYSTLGNTMSILDLKFYKSNFIQDERIYGEWIEPVDEDGDISEMEIKKDETIVINTYYSSGGVGSYSVHYKVIDGNLVLLWNSDEKYFLSEYAIVNNELILDYGAEDETTFRRKIK